MSKQNLCIRVEPAVRERINEVVAIKKYKNVSEYINSLILDDISENTRLKDTIKKLEKQIFNLAQTVSDQSRTMMSLMEHTKHLYNAKYDRDTDWMVAEPEMVYKIEEEEK